MSFIAVLCGDPGTPAEGYIEGQQFTFKSEVSFYCRPPFLLVGSSRRVCEADGSWSGMQPSCVGELRNGIPWRFNALIRLINHGEK